MQGVKAMPMLLPVLRIVSPRVLISARFMCCSAAAPSSFSMRTVRPTPRRPAVYKAVLHCDVVVGKNGLDVNASRLQHVGREIEVHNVAGVVLNDMQNSAAPLTALLASYIWSGVGLVKTAPGQAASSMPLPTKPPCIGSWPLPPPETRATLPFTGASLRAI